MAVTSNDEAGELTGRFNTMVEGLRERERIRETFGRYVDESVAATILRRQGEAALGRDRRGDHPVHRHRGLHHHRRVSRRRPSWSRR